MGNCVSWDASQEGTRKDGIVWRFGRPKRAGEKGKGGGAAAAGAVSDAEVAGAALRQRAGVRCGEVGLQDFRAGGRAGAVDVGGVSRAAADGSDIGFSLRDALELAEEGYTANVPLADLLRPDVLFTFEHDGEPLAAEHGGPLRLIVPHLYAWKSVKWV